MRLRLFKDVNEMDRALLSLVTGRLQKANAQPRAVILPGGKTPLALYRALAAAPVAMGNSIRILLSDERLVPFDSPESNYGKMKAMIQALGVEDSNVLRVDTSLPLDAAASRYDSDLRRYLRTGGRITLAVLGLGADGHTASLFNAQDILRGRGKFAIPVKRPDGMEGVSVTRDLLAKAEQIVVAACGVEKGEVVHRLIKDPGSLTAGMAVEDIRNVEVWYAP